MIVEKEKIYCCDICRKQEAWNKNWYSHTFLWDIRSDMTFTVCSEYCDRQLLALNKTARKKLYFSIYYTNKRYEHKR